MVLGVSLFHSCLLWRICNAYADCRLLFFMYRALSSCSVFSFVPYSRLFSKMCVAFALIPSTDRSATHGRCAERTKSLRRVILPS